MIAQPDPLAALFHDYGWAAVFLWLIYRDIWPFIKEHVFPAAIAERKQRIEAEISISERQAVSMKMIADAITEIKMAMVATNERLVDMRSAQFEHHRATSEAITLMRERTADLPVSAKTNMKSRPVKRE